MSGMLMWVPRIARAADEFGLPELCGTMLAGDAIRKGFNGSLMPF